LYAAIALLLVALEAWYCCLRPRKAGSSVSSKSEDASSTTSLLDGCSPSNHCGHPAGSATHTPHTPSLDLKHMQPADAYKQCGALVLAKHAQAQALATGAAVSTRGAAKPRSPALAMPNGLTPPGGKGGGSGGGAQSGAGGRSSQRMYAHLIKGLAGSRIRQWESPPFSQALYPGLTQRTRTLLLSHGHGHGARSSH
jgi:hypothetical protein